MLRLSIAFALVLSLPAVSQAAKDPSAKPSGAQVYGAAPTVTAEPLPLADAVKAENHGKTIRVKAPTAAVCKKKGCWLTLDADGTEVRVTFKDYAFFVPKDLAGKTVVVEGVLAEEIVSEKDARHYAKDEGLPKAEIAKIKGDQKSLTMVATSVVVE